MRGKVAKRLRRLAESKDPGTYKKYRIYAGVGGNPLRGYEKETLVLVNDCGRGIYLHLKKQYKWEKRYGKAEVEWKTKSVTRANIIRELLTKSGRKVGARIIKATAAKRGTTPVLLV